MLKLPVCFLIFICFVLRGIHHFCNFPKSTIRLSHPLHTMTGNLWVWERSQGLNSSQTLFFSICYTTISVNFHVNNWVQHYYGFPGETENIYRVSPLSVVTGFLLRLRVWPFRTNCSNVVGQHKLVLLKLNPTLNLNPTLALTQTTHLCDV